MRTARVHCLAGLIALLAALSTSAGDWPGWRGDGTGLSSDKGFPTVWNAGMNVRRRVTVPGYGWSSPIVSGEKVFVTTAICGHQQAPARNGPGGGEEAPDVVYRWEVYCLDRATGKTLWKQVAAQHKPRAGNHISNTYASETPVTDGQHVYAYFGMVGVFRSEERRVGKERRSRWAPY